MYSLKVLWLLSTDPTVWLWCAADVVLSISKYLQSLSIIEFLYSVPMSILNVLIGPYFRIKDSNIAFAIVVALLLATGMATKYFVRSHIKVTTYSLPFSVPGNGRIVSTITLSKALDRVSVMVNGV